MKPSSCPNDRDHFKGLLGPFHPIHTENVLRARYAEDRLAEAIAAGVGQYVILGAGLDSYASPSAVSTRAGGSRE